MRRRFALAAALPALVALAAMAYLADRLIRRALEDELGTRLTVAAQATAASLPAERILRLSKGDERTRAYGYIRGRLDALARATATRIFVIKPDRTALADSDGGIVIGEPVPALERDRFEIARAARGQVIASQVLFTGRDGLLYKTGYAPLRDAAGRVVAVVGADGTAPSFETYRRFRRLFALFAVAGAVLAALVAAVVSLTVTRSLTRLTAAARRIGRGDLATPLREPGPSFTRGLGQGERGSPRRSDEIGTLRDTLEEMRRALHARDEEREVLLAGIAHEVRNPLGALDLFAGLLAEELVGRPEAAHVERLRAELSALEKVVREFLEYARVRPEVREDVDLRAVAAEVADLCAPLAEERKVSLTAEGEGAARGDREQLRRALVNLARNAVEAAPAASEVTVRLRGDARGAVLDVEDRGPGFTSEARGNLFRPFYTTKSKGTGLGLALAKKVAEAHGGTLQLLPREGGGTVARVELPGDQHAARGTGRFRRPGGGR